MKKAVLFFCLCLLAYVVVVYHRGESSLPPLENGDLAFQTTWTNQSMAIGLASFSLYIHTGIIKLTDHGPMVIQAGRTVGEVPLHDWIDQGMLHRFAVYRYQTLTDAQRQRIVDAAKVYYGRPYNYYFSFGSDAVYCSQLDYLAYKDSGVALDDAVPTGSLYINNRFVKALIEQRWQGYPLCRGKNIGFAQCYALIMQQPIVTPAAIASDKHLKRIFTNYY